ncbi:MAG: multifunctional oxoglutarate decarboxylase/oxoglutarate dehydrogenase thiamine pyrophosphate-binding subunit/dihydrolipoyllysine-residue succinyltransferase subunit [Candidatus Nanopelagicales bacterium]|nr:multifunctional oxoglutarate decarboxylase/oxoglutarate dehydrogenase thiamine pyrophosphate-binding subunit/dihydrolipoyllysine-residue succinyltransferase subunit [Candidatus Nanopelagicales bacterium]MDP4667065.1 multifunctional oxoglutarate decarboxylase/oxoglutarate dehydrogenase thiamine pyrophosphate-binding subunit/dihydrolipoyllysine-residue succinyltransferase subunit [Candidatus Nanopelagicales bacterium]MDP4895979.1 multifunctional oxoglutarate decarboxylase/oxoglutarate dehydrogen
MPGPVNSPFGANDWLVDEMYQEYLADKNSVDSAWWEFFADYSPSEHSPKAAVSNSTLQPRLSAPAPAASVATPSPASAPTPAVNQASPSPGTPAAAPVTPAQVSSSPEVIEKLKGASARVVTNMEASLEVPTATSVRAIPAKLMVDNRIVINNHLARGRGGKVSFTHIIGFAIVRALREMPDMNVSYTTIDDKPAISRHQQVGLGLAIDLAKEDGSRQLLVPCIKGADQMDFAAFWAGYEDVVRKARSGKLTVEDFQGTTASLTNPGTIGTVHSVPRLMPGQGVIIGVGAMDYPAEWQGASDDSLARNAVSKTLTLTSTYDHRVIQGAQSGDFLRRVHNLLIGDSNFYEDIFRALLIPYEPIRWAQDLATSHDADLDKTARVQEMIHAFRVRGHLLADIDPLEYHQRSHPDLDIASHAMTLWDLDREFATGGFSGRPFAKLREILGTLRDAYCRTIGVEYMHIQDPGQRKWIQDRLEKKQVKVDRDEQLRILRKLNEAEAFENFLQTKYVGQKRFSLEGGESAIPFVDQILIEAANAQLDEVCIGMMHRGRLNVLANIAGKGYGRIFSEFEGNYGEESVQGSGDVKYHLGTKSTYKTATGAEVKVYLAANPSHLEAVDPVLEGIVRAKQDIIGIKEKYSVLPLVLHGDAAFAGQGVVAETLQMSQLQGYRVGGTIHLIINNQVGFTTSPRYGRTSVYPTDVARMIQAPVFHVNGDDPEAVVRVAQLAFEFRQEFHKDVVIDLVCYRRRGHNEADDPSLTQPLMYEIIDQKRSVRKLYTEALVGRGDITLDEAEDALKHYQNELESVFQTTKSETTGHFNAAAAEVISHGQQTLEPQTPTWEVPTAITREVIDRVVESQTKMPDGFTVHPRLAPQLARRADMVANDAIDWGMGEALAIGSLLTEGTVIRLAGQDSRRGTFGHRHAVIVDKNTGWQYKPLKTCYEAGAKLDVYDSLLSEYAAMGFEYGYSVIRPEALTMWEAQFGDFANGAQTMIDEYITTGEQKWAQKSSLVLLLPHGHEGQGPDHSSARVERFLQQCAQDNITVAMPTTPASFFHLLRWQVKSTLIRPLVVFTPKSLLRAKFATSKVSDFTEGTFKAIIGDTTASPDEVKTVLLCSGKVYYDLVAEREKLGRKDVAIVRLERLYPLPTITLPPELARYKNLSEIRWVQEEPANQGAWSFMAMNLPELINRQLTVVSRPASSSPAVGSHHRSELEQQALVAQAFN